MCVCVWLAVLQPIFLTAERWEGIQHETQKKKAQEAAIEREEETFLGSFHACLLVIV